MGSASSKEQQQPKVFLPTTPTEFSSGLLSKLDSSVESDYTRTQYTEKYIQDRVSEELRKIEKESTETLKKALENLPDSKSDSKGGDDSNSLKEKLQTLKSKLDSRPSPKKPSKELTTTRDALVQCFKDNKGKPLNCWDQVEAFKVEVSKQA